MQTKEREREALLVRRDSAYQNRIADGTQTLPPGFSKPCGREPWTEGVVMANGQRVTEQLPFSAVHLPLARREHEVHPLRAFESRRTSAAR